MFECCKLTENTVLHLKISGLLQSEKTPRKQGDVEIFNLLEKVKKLSGLVRENQIMANSKNFL